VSNKVVAHYLDGRILKGLSVDVDPSKAICHVRSAGKAPVEVALAELKALYLVRDLEGDPGRHESIRVAPEDSRLHGSTIVTLQFPDGEKLVGLMNRYPPNRPFFFLVPIDRGSNNIRILVNAAAVSAMEARAEG
jgi:hypothetical protein